MALTENFSSEKYGKPLGGCKIESESASPKFKECRRLVEQWNVKDTIIATCFDTTGSNSGRMQGASKQLKTTLIKEYCIFFADITLRKLF